MISSLVEAAREEGPLASELARLLELSMAPELSRLPDPELNFPPRDWVHAEAALARCLRRLPPADLAGLRLILDSPAAPTGPRCLLLRILSSRPGLIEDQGLRDLLQDQDQALAWEAAMALSPRPPTTETIEALRKLVRRERGWGRQYYLVALLNLGTTDALGDALACLDDDEPAVVRHAAAYLSHCWRRVSDPTVRAGIEAALDRVIQTHPDPDTRWIVSHHRRGSQSSS